MGPNGRVSSFAYRPDTAPVGTSRLLANITHTLGAVQQAQHIYDHDRAGRIIGWEQRSIGQPNMKSNFDYNLGDELVRAQDRNLSANTATDQESWGLDDGGNWLSHTRSSGNLMETRKVDAMNRLQGVGGAGSTVIDGHVNEFSQMWVNSQPTPITPDPVSSGYRFKRTVAVTQGSNTVQITAKDQSGQTTQQNWQFTAPAASRTFTYDNNGNTLSDGIRTFTWDAKNRLKTVTKAGVTWKWDYDYRDRRVKEYQNDVLTKYFIWSGNQIIQERNASNVITRTHYKGGFIDGATPATGTNYQTLTDHLGNVREVLTATGAIAARYDYTAYQGAVKIGTSTVDPTFLTIGNYYHHAGSGLDLALYRAYDPELGRWLSADPIGEQGGLNLYGYVGGDPINKFDPSGLASWKNHWDALFTWTGDEFKGSLALGAMATADGFVPGIDPFKDAGKYSGCEGGVGFSKGMGQVAFGAAALATGVGAWGAAGLPTIGVGFDLTAGHAFWGVTQGGTTTMMHALGGTTTAIGASGWALGGSGVVSLTGIPIIAPAAALAAGVPASNCVSGAIGATVRGIIGK